MHQTKRKTNLSVLFLASLLGLGIGLIYFFTLTSEIHANGFLNGARMSLVVGDSGRLLLNSCRLGDIGDLINYEIASSFHVEPGYFYNNHSQGLLYRTVGTGFFPAYPNLVNRLLYIALWVATTLLSPFKPVFTILTWTLNPLISSYLIVLNKEVVFCSLLLSSSYLYLRRSRLCILFAFSLAYVRPSFFVLFMASSAIYLSIILAYRIISGTLLKALSKESIAAAIIIPSLTLMLISSAMMSSILRLIVSKYAPSTSVYSVVHRLAAGIYATLAPFPVGIKYHVHSLLQSCSNFASIHSFVYALLNLYPALIIILLAFVTLKLYLMKSYHFNLTPSPRAFHLVALLTLSSFVLGLRGDQFVRQAISINVVNWSIFIPSLVASLRNPSSLLKIQHK